VTNSKKSGVKSTSSRRTLRKCGVSGQIVTKLKNCVKNLLELDATRIETL
jgi:hypothetical protein